MRINKIIKYLIIMFGFGILLSPILLALLVNNNITVSDSKVDGKSQILQTIVEESQKDDKTKKSVVKEIKEETKKIIKKIRVNKLKELKLEKDFSFKYNEADDETENLKRFLSENFTFFQKYTHIEFLYEHGLLDQKLFNYLKVGEQYKDSYKIFYGYDTFNKSFLSKDIFLNLKEFDISEFKTTEDIKDLLEFKNNLETGKIELNESNSFLSEDLENDTEFKFILDGIFGDNSKMIFKTIFETSKIIDEDPILVSAAIFTDQVRGIMTQRGFMKNVMKSYAPLLFSFTQGSYGVGGIKSFTAEKILKDTKSNGYWDGFILLKEEERTENQWKGILTTKFNEGLFPTFLIKNIKLRWQKASYPIDDKIGIIMTLYNFGNIEEKKPNGNPQVGGSVIKLNDNEYVFGALGEAFYWYFKIYQIDNFNAFIK